MAKPPPGFILDQPQENVSANVGTPSANAAIPAPPPGFELDQGPKAEPEEERGILDFIMGLPAAGFELPAMTLTGAVAEPIAGLAGIAGAVLPGETDQSAKWIEKTREALTYQPKGQTTQDILGTVGSAAHYVGDLPGVKQVVKTPEYLGDIGAAAGRLTGSQTMEALGGTIGKSAIPIFFELLGLKGTRAAKKAALGKVLKGQNIAEFYDEAGMLRPDIVDAIKSSNLSPDDVRQFLPPSITTEEAAQGLAKKISKAETLTGIGEETRMRDLAQEFKPSAEKIKRFEELDVDYLPQYVSENPTANAIAENLKDIPGSLMDDAEKQIVERLGQVADDTIVEAGGTLDKADLSIRFDNKAKDVGDKLADRASELYDRVGKKIDVKTPIEPTKTMELLREELANTGGDIIDLEPIERKMIRRLDPAANPTYYRLDKIRKQVGKQLRGKETPFKNVDEATLKKYYSALTDDQEQMLLKMGDEDLLKTYQTGKRLVATRKKMEEQLQNVIGKKLQGDITKKMGSAMKGLTKGNLKAYMQVVDNLPKTMGKKMRRDVIASALNDAFTNAARTGKKISIGGFDNFWQGIKRNPRVLKQLTADLGKTTMDRVQLLADVNRDLSTAMKLSVKTGRQISTPGLFDEVNGIAARLYGLGKQRATKTPILGRLVEVFGDVRTKKRSKAADELLTSAKFRKILRENAKGRINSSKRRQNINKMLAKIKEYRDWKNTLDKTQLSDLMAMGGVEYLTNQALDLGEED